MKSGLDEEDIANTIESKNDVPKGLQKPSNKVGLEWHVSGLIFLLVGGGLSH